MEFIAAYSKSKGNERLNNVITKSEQAARALAKHAHSILAVSYLPLGG